MRTNLNLTDADSANRMLSHQNERDGENCTGAFTPKGEVTASPSPMPTIDGPEFFLAAEIIFGEAWAASHEQELSIAGFDGTLAWRDGPDGFFSRSRTG